MIQPWLKPLDKYDSIAIRIDGVRYNSAQFRSIRLAFLRPLQQGLPPLQLVYNFQPEDIFADERGWPKQYSWIQIVGHYSGKDPEDCLGRYRSDVEREFKKLGVNVPWRMAFIRQDGRVFHAP